jgi:hypothetical protein
VKGNGIWERLPPIDDPLFAGITTWSQCVAVNRKLVLIGGFYPCVYIYDFESAKKPKKKNELDRTKMIIAMDGLK